MIDCDVHAAIDSIEQLFPWLDPHWREVAQTTQFRGPTDTAYPPGAATSLRPDLAAEPAARQEARRRARLALDPWDIETAILVCQYGTEACNNPDAAAALSTAANRWQVEEWLDREPRLRGSIVVPARPTGAAVEEIERVGGHPGFVQVLLPVRSLTPYGSATGGRSRGGDSAAGWCSR